MPFSTQLANLYSRDMNIVYVQPYSFEPTPCFLNSIGQDEVLAHVSLSVNLLHPRPACVLIFPAAVADIDATAEETVLVCPATDVTVNIEFDVPVSSASSSSASQGVSSGATITGNRCRVCNNGRGLVW